MRVFVCSLVCLVCVSILYGQPVKNANTAFIPGSVWKDTDNNFINAHGGGVLYYNGVYYWYGEYKRGETTLVPDVGWDDYQTVAGGVSCYSSKDLLNWKFEGVAMASEKKDTSSDIYQLRVIERPKVIYNKKTKKFVMWMHIDTRDYAASRTGVAVSDKPQGPFRYLRSERPNGSMSRDMNLFQDDDGKAYHFFASETNATMRICLLSDDYLSHTGTEKRILIGRSREAPAPFKYNNKYYLITSACSGWDPNKATYAVADSIFGDWKEYGNPCTGPDADSTYFGQSTFVLPVHAEKGQFIFIADRWKKKDLADSRYLWLPLNMQGNAPKVTWYDSWTMKDLKN